MRHLVRLLLIALALGPLACPAASSAQQNLVLQSAAEPPGLDLTATPASATAGVVFYNVQEALVKVDRHGKLVPWLAEKWHTSDNKNYTFFLKHGVRFQNGRELKAADVKFVFDRAMNPETKHPAVKQYEVIGDIIVKDDYTITFALKTTNANFLLTMARQGSVIYPREAVDTLKSEPIGTGPYKIGEWVRGDRIVLVKNPRFQVIIGETTNDVIMSMNNSKKPFTDVRVRRAVTYGINKPEVVKGAMFGFGRVLGTNVDPLNPYFVDMAGAMPYEPAKAKKLLAEAGYPNGFEAVLKVAPQYYYTVRTGEVLVDQLQKVGVKIKIEQIEWGQWLSRVWKDADYDLTIIGHAEAWDIANYANPKYYFRYDSADFQKLFQDSEVTVDDKARRELYVKMQKKLVEDAPVVWLYIHPRLAVTKKGLQGFWKDLPAGAGVNDLSEVAWIK